MNDRFSPAAADTDPSTAFKLAMRRVAHTVAIVTTRVDGHPYGLIATSYASVSAEPPTFLVCVDRFNSTHEAIDVSGMFAVNVLGAADQAIAEQFARPERRPERFGTGAWIDLATGAPVLASAQAAFDCVVTDRVLQHTHTVFFGRVEAITTSAEGVDPLVYVNRAFHRVGPA